MRRWGIGVQNCVSGEYTRHRVCSNGDRANFVKVAMNFIFNLICRCSGFILIVCLFSNTSVCSAEESRLDDPATWANPSFWKSLKQSGETTGWEFHDGEISLVRPGKKGGNGSILSEPVASNFELSFEWKIAANVNSGVKYRRPQTRRTVLDYSIQRLGVLGD